MTIDDHPTRIPLLPLLPFRDETEWPACSEGNVADDERWDLGAELIATSDLNSAIEAMQGAMSDPSVSILAGTTPGERMTEPDSARLRYLMRKVARRLCQAGNRQRLSGVQARLARAVSLAQTGSTQSGLAIFISKEQSAIVLLPFAPKDRVVIGRCFATRDLVYAAQRFPVYRLLVLTVPAPRLLEGRGHHLAEIIAPTPEVSSEPSFVDAIRRRLRAEQRRRNRAMTGDRSTTRGRSMSRGRCRAVLMTAEALLDAGTADSGELPLIVVGSPRLVRVFRTSSGHAHSIIGEVRGWYPRASVDQLAYLAQPVLDHWHADRRDQALRALTSAERAGSVVWGVQAAWNAVRQGLVEHLWVDRDYVVPARRGGNGSVMEVASPEGIGMIDDAVDGLIQMTTIFGRRVDILDRLAPTHRDAIAVELRCAASVPLRVPTNRRSPYKLGRRARSPPGSPAGGGVVTSTRMWWCGCDGRLPGTAGLPPAA